MLPRAMTTPDDPAAALDSHRQQIEALDRQILELVSQRQALATRIGELKRAAKIPLRNFGVEAEVHRRLARACEELALDPTIGHELAQLLIKKSVERQAAQRDVDYPGASLDVLVIGGKGGMGRWFVRFLSGQGHRVTVCDPAPDACDVREVPELAAACRGQQLAIVAVPMEATLPVLERLRELDFEGVAVEICSLKNHLEPRIAELTAAGLRAVSIHPMFGPGTRMLSDRTVVFCEEGAAEDLALVTSLFEQTSARRVRMPRAEHDRRMAVVLGAAHLINLAFARAVQRSGIEAASLYDVASVTFERQLETTREVANENPGLYHEIQRLTRGVGDPAAWIREAIDDWERCVQADDGEAFRALMRGCSDYLGDGIARGGAPR